MPITNRFFVLHALTPSINAPAIFRLWWHEPEEGPCLPDFAYNYPEVYEYVGPGSVYSIHEVAIFEETNHAQNQSVKGADNAIFGQVLQDYGHRTLLKFKVESGNGVGDQIITSTSWTSALGSDIEDWWQSKGLEAFRNPEYARRLTVLALEPDSSGSVLRERKVFELVHRP